MVFGMVKVIVSDLDGTLLNEHHQVTDLTRVTVERVVAEGKVFLVATGRPYDDVRAIVDCLPDGVCCISANGARVHSHSGELISSASIQAGVVKRVLTIADGYPIHANIYSDEGWFVEQDNAELLALHVVSGYRYQKVDFSDLGLSSVSKVFFVGDEAALIDLQGEL